MRSDPRAPGRWVRRRGCGAFIRLTAVCLFSGSAAAQDVVADSLALREIERRIEALTLELEALRLGSDIVAPADTTVLGFGPAASKIYGAQQGVSIGGYGEFIYENFSESREDGSPSGRTDQVDALRGIVYVGYKFDERFLFNSGNRIRTCFYWTGWIRLARVCLPRLPPDRRFRSSGRATAKSDGVPERAPRATDLPRGQAARDREPDHSNHVAREWIRGFRTVGTLRLPVLPHELPRRCRRWLVQGRRLQRFRTPRRAPKGLQGSCGELFDGGTSRLGGERWG